MKITLILLISFLAAIPATIILGAWIAGHSEYDNKIIATSATVFFLALEILGIGVCFILWLLGV